MLRTKQKEDNIKIAYNFSEIRFRFNKRVLTRI
jgi:hypothetical protein